MDDHLTMITGLTGKERKRVLSWVASLQEETVIGIFQEGVKKSFQVKEEHPELPGRITKYCSFLLAARKSGWDTVKGKGYRVAGQEQYENFSHLRKARAAVFVQNGRTPVLRRKILAYWGEIQELKAEGIGFRPIAAYLAKTRKVQTSASYLVKLWKEVEGND
jgi:hypothetical protein